VLFPTNRVKVILTLGVIFLRPIMVPALVMIGLWAVLQFVNGLAAVGTDDVWAVGFDASLSRERTLAAHWDGHTWSIVPTPAGAGGDEQLHAVTALGSGDVWAVGDDLPGAPSTATPFAEHWNGGAWTRVPVPTARGNGRLFGTVTNAQVPTGSVQVAEQDSPTMASLIRSTNVPSNNFMAEMLLKDVGGAFGGSGSVDLP